MKKKTSPLLVLAVLCVCLCGAASLFVLRPVPDLDYINWKYPEIKGIIPESAIGTRVQVFLDPSFYYKFDASQADAAQLATLLKLERVDQASHCFRPTGLFWHDLWWRPDAQSTPMLFNAYREGDDICLMYDSKDKIIYLYIQNT